MLCNKCQEREATVHMTKIINGKKTQMNLCDICAQQDSTISFGFEPNWMLQNIFAELFNQSLSGNKPLKLSRTKPVQCEHCSFTETQFSKVGKLGCPKCYEVFGDKLEPVLRRVHGNAIHTGKIPKRTGRNLGLKKELEQLRSRLHQAINREEYELAAELRDKIRNLESQLD